jgi:predicted nucleic acid-binding protein
VTTLVVDASVVAKWVLPVSDEEPDAGRALAVLHGLKRGDVRMVQPPHWLAEVAAVLARLDSERALAKIGALYALGVPTAGGFEVYERATALSVSLGHHLFDTLYHAVALETPGAVLLTADERYFAKARGEGSIERLADYRVA